MKVQAYKVTLKTPSGESVIECSEVSWQLCWAGGFSWFGLNGCVDLGLMRAYQCCCLSPSVQDTYILDAADEAGELMHHIWCGNS